MLGSIISACGQGLIWGIMVLGVYITYKILDVADLTVDGSFATGGCVFAIMLSYKMSPTIALIIAIIAGGLCGYVTGFLHTKCKIPAILAGILTQLALYSVNLRVLNDKANMSISIYTTNITSISKMLGLNHTKSGIVLGLIMAVFCIVVLYAFFGTEFGSSIRATGNNEIMAKAQGINTDKMKLLGIIISNMLIALSGALLVQVNKYADVSMGKGAIVYGLASIVIGDVIFRHFENFGVKLFSSVIGCIIFFIIRAVVIRLGLKANDMQMLSSLIVVIALSMPILKEKLTISKGGH